MSRFLIWVAFIVYLPLCFGSSQPSINLGNFSNQSFTPRGAVVPDQSPSDLSPGVTMIEGFTQQPIGFNNLSSNEETLITVTGNVKNMSAPIRNARGDTVQQLVNTSGVKVMFWQPQTPGFKRSTITDDNGNYTIELTNGFWRGEACGSGMGYSPNAWEVSLRDNQLIQMREVSYSAPKITPNQIDLAMLQNNLSSDNAISTFLKVKGAELSINGEGFGCNGSLVFDFHNSVNNCSEVSPVQYNHQLIVKNDFDSRSDTKIKLPMPGLFDATTNNTAQHDDIRRIAKMYYQKGNQRSNAIFVGEYVGEAFTGVAYEGACLDSLSDEINNNGQLTDQSGELENIGQFGTGLIINVTGNIDSTSGVTGATSGTPVQTVGSPTMTGQDIATELDLEFTVDTGSFQLNLGR